LSSTFSSSCLSSPFTLIVYPPSSTSCLSTPFLSSALLPELFISPPPHLHVSSGSC
jgi:hypothetical protein